MKTSIGITQKNTNKVAECLNQLLADEHVLYIKTRNAHWNVEGPDFLSMHEFFEELYKGIEKVIDDMAERIRTIGHYAEGSLEDFLKLTHLTEKKRAGNKSKDFIALLLEDHNSIIIKMRENIDKISDEWNDEGTADFITGVMKTHEKWAWLLRAHLS